MIGPIGSATTSIINKQAGRETGESTGSSGITSNFSKMFDEVNRSQMEAETKITEMVAGRNKDIAGTMISMEKAETSVRMLMGVRNKVVNAYEEIMRMQI